MPSSEATAQVMTPPQEDMIGDIRPLVARTASNRAVWLFAALLAVAAGALFVTLENRRAASGEGGIGAPTADAGGMISSPPPLAIPPDAAAVGYPFTGYPAGLPAPAAVTLRDVVPGPTRSTGVQPRMASEPHGYAQAPAPSPGPGYVWQAPQPAPVVAAEPAPRGATDRVEATRLRNPSQTVAQGTVIQAVLETALDSTRTGHARAIVSRDVLSFDGTRVLIPRGSRLFGDYAADIQLGQKRALIQWQRLTRPDGAIIEVASPSADALGRAGVKGKVNSHFFQRFAGAILQSALDVGVRLATREAAGDTVVVALPGAGITTQKPEEIKPTLKVRQGTSVTVFVARDLDFSPVEY